MESFIGSPVPVRPSQDCIEMETSGEINTDGCYIKPSECKQKNREDCKTQQTKHNNKPDIKLVNRKLTTVIDQFRKIRNQVINDLKGLKDMKLKVSVEGGNLKYLRVQYDTSTLAESDALGSCELYNFDYTGGSTPRDANVHPKLQSTSDKDLTFYRTRKLNDTVAEYNEKDTKLLVRQIYLFDSLPIKTLNDGRTDNSDKYTGLYKGIESEVGSFTKLMGSDNSNLLYNVKMNGKGKHTPHQTIDKCEKICKDDTNCRGYTLVQKPVAYTRSGVKVRNVGDPSFQKTVEDSRFIRSVPRNDNGITINLVNKTGIDSPTDNVVNSEYGILATETQLK